MKTILAIQPNLSRIGYAVFKGSKLVSHGTKPLGWNRTLAYRVHRVGMPFIRNLVELHTPDVIVLPPRNNPAGTGRNRFLLALKIDLRFDRTTMATFSRYEIQKVFGSLIRQKRPSKDVTMGVLTKWFPELLRYLPRTRRIWDPQDYWISMFDAVSLAITYMHHNE